MAAVADTSPAVFEAFENKKPVITLEERAHRSAVKGYELAMTKIGHKLLSSGVETGLVAQICRPPDEPKPHHLNVTSPGQPALPALPSLPVSGQQSPDRSLRALAAQAEEPRVNLDPVAQVGSALYSKEGAELDGLARFHKIQQRMERDLRYPPEPPQHVLKKGGHLLLCVVSCSSTESNAEMETNSFGPPMGITHFIRPLCSLAAGQQHPDLIVLGECLPSDWSAVAEDPHVFFVAGSPLSVSDLDRCGFRTAAAIATARCHDKITQKSSKKIADARSILVTTIIEAQFTRSAPPPVITDLAYDASIVFLPQSQAMMLAMSHINARPPKRAGSAGSSFMELPALDGGDRKKSSAERRADQHNLAVVADEEDYDILETPDYSEHPRFMNGTVFVNSVMTSLVANSMHNHAMVSAVCALLKAPFLLLDVPVVWQGQSYADLHEWLIKSRNLLALGIYRNSLTPNDGESNSADNKRPSVHYMFTAPPAYKTILHRSDRVLVLAPSAK
jgi:hypothetical protein